MPIDNGMMVLQKLKVSQVAAARAFNPSTREAEAGGSLNLRSTWSTEQVTEETLPPKKTKTKDKLKMGQTWQNMPVILALEKQRKGEHPSYASLAW